jgi:hypothetical protein
MKYLQSFKLFEGVSVPSLEEDNDSTSEIDLDKISKNCGTCKNTSTSQNLPLRSDYEKRVQQILKNKYPGLETKIQSVLNSSKKWYVKHYSRPETINKFKKSSNHNIILNFINKEIKINFWNLELATNFLESKTYSWKNLDGQNIGWVWPTKAGIINLNLDKMSEDENFEMTIPHEMSHCIFLKLKALGEDPTRGNKDISNSTSPRSSGQGISKIVDKEGIKKKKLEIYITNPEENAARMFTLRRVLEILPTSSCEQIKNIFEKNLKSKKLVFENLEFIGFQKSGGCYLMKLKTPDYLKSFIQDSSNMIDGKLRLSAIYTTLYSTFNGQKIPDIQRLLSIYSYYKDGIIWVDLSKLTKLNTDLVLDQNRKTGDNIYS